MIGLIGLLVALACCVIGVACAAAALLTQRAGKREASESLAWAARLTAVLGAAALTVCCGLLVYCFLTGNLSMQYVLENHSNASGALGVLYRVSGLWAGREGSLLFWAWLIAVFGAVMVLRSRRDAGTLDTAALAVLQAVLTAFVCVLLFSEDNMPFRVVEERYLNADGTLASAASLLGMNSLLEHWAMAIHPPALFVGYAGLTVPFAYAVAALITGDDSSRWVERCTPVLMFAWLFLGAGIGLGAVWAYVVLGWGGYWGWDPVENASLLPWLSGVALIHSLVVYRRRGAFRRWSVMCACITFCLVVLGTFVTRSGIVESVHAFEGDPVSLALFLGLMIASLLAGGVGLLLRRKSFGVAELSATGQDGSLLSKEGAFYLNNLVMMLSVALISYLTLCSALPSWMPLGGQAVAAGTFNAVARPLGTLYLGMLAVCPLLGWHKTDPGAFKRAARVPGICAAALFALLMVLFFTKLLPAYNAALAAGGSQAELLAEQGPALYYNGLAVAAFAVASLLFFNAGFMLARSLKGLKAGEGAPLRTRLATLGGCISHAALAVILVGLVGSSMYVTERAGYLSCDVETDTAPQTYDVGPYQLSYVSNYVEKAPNGDDIIYSMTFEVYRDGAFLGTATPAVQLVTSTMQQKMVASVVSMPLEDLFIVYRGLGVDGSISLDVRINPLISFVWLGYIVLMIGSALSVCAKRRWEEAGAHGE